METMTGGWAPSPQLHRPLRVALVSNSAFGESASRLRWAVLFRERGLAPRFTLPFGDDETVKFIEAGGIGVDRYPLERRSPGLGKGLRSIAALTRIFRERKFDVVHTFAHEPNLYGAVAARLAGVPVLVTQVTGLGRVRFLMVGGADAGNPRSISLDQLEIGNKGSITLTGERKDVRQLLAITDIFVNPSPREGLPRASLEAMAMARPVIALAVPGSRETVEHGTNGWLIPPGDVPALAGALAQMAMAPALRERMGLASRRRVLELFRVESSVDQIEALYRQRLHSAGRHPATIRGRRPEHDWAS